MKDETNNQYQKSVNKAVDYINSHLYNMPSITELSNIVNISSFHFHRIFKMIIDENIGEFVTRLRLEDIALRLLMSKENLTDIALQTGYGNKYALSKAFKNHFGISPSIYRTQAKNTHPFFGDKEQKIIELSPKVKNIKSVTVVYIRIIDVYGASEAYTNAWSKLENFGRENNLIDNSTEYLGLSFDDPSITNPNKCRFYACFISSKPIIPTGAFGVRQIPGGKYAVFIHKGAYQNLKNTYYNIYIEWLPKSSFKIRGSMSFEKYLNYTKNESKLLTEIYIPIK